MFMYVANVNGWDTNDVRVCATLEDAKHWLAHEGIEADEWRVFYESLAEDERRGSMTIDRTGMTPDQILEAWAEPDAANGARGESEYHRWGDAEYHMSVERQEVYSRE